MPNQNCAHGGCNCKIEQGQGGSRGNQTTAEIIAQIPAQSSRENVRASLIFDNSQCEESPFRFFSKRLNWQTLPHDYQPDPDTLLKLKTNAIVTDLRARNQWPYNRKLAKTFQMSNHQPGHYEFKKL